MYTSTFKDAADHCLFTTFGLIQSQITVHNAEIVYRQLVSVL